MAAISRQPFAPLDGARLQTLTSLKNRQNAISTNSPVKRKASEVLDADDFENVDPLMFSKRSKGSDSSFASKEFFKPSAFVLTKAPSTPAAPKDDEVSLAKPAPTNFLQAPRPRTLLQPKSPAARLNTNIAKSSPLSAPAGRSPTRGSKRIGILSNRRRTAGPFSRVDPPSFGLGAPAAPFSLDAALKGTLSSYASSRTSALPSSLLDTSPALESEAGLKSSWFFDIHEDTPEQEMTNLLQHSTCVLDISSDEESEQKARRDRDEGRDKENIPPADDVSQTSGTRRAAADAAPVNADDMVFEKARGPLMEMNAADYYADGCDDSTVVIVPGDDDAEGEVAEHEHEQLPQVAASIAQEPLPEEVKSFEFAPEIKLLDVSIDEVMEKSDESAAKAAVLEPIEGTGETFELWESGSAKDEAEPQAPASPTPFVEAEPAAIAC